MARTYTVELPHGIPFNGEFYKEVEMKVLTGEIRAEVTKLEKMKNKSNQLDIEVLAYLIVKLGNKEHPTKKDIGELTLGDINHLLIELKLHSGKQSEINIDATCGNKVCGETNNTSIDLKKIKYKDVKSDDLKAWTDKQFQCFKIKNDTINDDGEEVTIEYTFRMPTAQDKKVVTPYADDMDLMQQALLTCTLLAVNGDSSDDVVNNGICTLPTGDLDELMEKWIEFNHGPNLQDEIKCWNCNTRNPIELDITHFLFSKGASKK